MVVRGMYFFCGIIHTIVYPDIGGILLKHWFLATINHHNQVMRCIVYIYHLESHLSLFSAPDL